MTEIIQQENHPIPYQEARAKKEETIWDTLSKFTVADAITEFLATLQNANTQKNYRSGMNQLILSGFVNPMETLQVFALRTHENVLDGIKGVSEWSEASRQARAALYCAFTRYLSRRSEGVIRRAIPSREGTTKTFFKVRDKVATRPLNKVQWGKFLEALDKINRRDALIARVMLQGGKRKSEVLSLQTDQIDWNERTITFMQVKTKGTAKETVITYPQHVMKELGEYLAERTGHVFITSTGKPVQPTQIDRTFAKAGEKARIEFKVSPHVLRTSAVTYYKGNGYSDTDIMKVTGHANANMVAMYDRTELGENASRKESLV